ncbi:MAG: hypothetical protein P4L16_00945 [Chlamydiales bacterium]|nr:hypothetical protein [Chlamydiales bacterium]
MKRFLLAGLLLFLPLAMHAFSLCNQWNVATRVGPSFLTHNSSLNTVASDTIPGSGTTWGHIGPIFDAKVGYGLGNYFVLGVEADWEYHRFPNRAILDSFGDAFNFSGRFQTATVLVFLEWRPIICYDFVPYISVAGGGNINWVNNFPRNYINIFKAANTWGYKGAIGFDYQFACNVAFNLEAGWLYNRGTWRTGGFNGIGEQTTAIGTFNCDSASLLCGFRFYY